MCLLSSSAITFHIEVIFCSSVRQSGFITFLKITVQLYERIYKLKIDFPDSHEPLDANHFQYDFTNTIRNF